MKLQDMISKLKQARLKVVDFHLHDLDRAGDLLLALTLAITLTGIVVAQFSASGHVFVPPHAGRIPYM